MVVVVVKLAGQAGEGWVLRADTAGHGKAETTARPPLLRALLGAGDPRPRGGVGPSFTHLCHTAKTYHHALLPESQTRRHSSAKKMFSCQETDNPKKKKNWCEVIMSGQI